MRLRAFFCLCFLVLGGQLHAERWYKLYDRARDDLKAGRLESAVQNLHEAIKQNPQSGPSVRGEGTKRMQYFPYFLLGKVYFRLGQHELASRLFKQELRTDLPTEMAAELSGYERQIQAAAQERKQLQEFERWVARATEARQRGDLAEAAADLRQARDVHQAEFSRRNLPALLTSVLEQNRQDQEPSKVHSTVVSSPAPPVDRRTPVAKAEVLGGPPVQKTEVIARPPAPVQRSAAQAIASSAKRNAPLPKKPTGTWRKTKVPAIPAAKPKAVATGRDPEIRRAVLGAYKDEPADAIEQLERLIIDRGVRSAELECSTGIAYARLSLLTPASSERERFRSKAAEHFRLALALNPRQKLNARLVAPQILELFSSAAQ